MVTEKILRRKFKRDSFEKTMEKTARMLLLVTTNPSLRTAVMVK